MAKTTGKTTLGRVSLTEKNSNRAATHPISGLFVLLLVLRPDFRVGLQLSASRCKNSWKCTLVESGKTLVKY